MNRCLRCGNSNRGSKPRYDCSCGFYLVPISARMLPVARLLDGYGFRIASATDKIFVVSVDERVEVTMLILDFAQEYDKRIFTDLPEGFSHEVYKLVDYDTGVFSTYSRIAHADQFFPALVPDKETRYALRAAVRRLYAWAEDMRESGRWHVYVLGGLI